MNNNEKLAQDGSNESPFDSLADAPSFEEHMNNVSQAKDEEAEKRNATAGLDYPEGLTPSFIDETVSPATKDPGQENFEAERIAEARRQAEEEAKKIAETRERADETNSEETRKADEAYKAAIETAAKEQANWNAADATAAERAEIFKNGDF